MCLFRDGDIPHNTFICILYFNIYRGTYRGADKSLARPGREQARATENFEFHIPYL
jgi:hypothetical protein